MESLKWLVKDCKLGDSLVFYFSGHGTQQHDKEDENFLLKGTIFPVDFLREGMITNNEINSTIVEPLKDSIIFLFVGIKFGSFCSSAIYNSYLLQK
jgi:hypothetical protein